MVKISVVIASFNCEEFICDAIESVLHQTFKDYEIIVIDDGSTDNTKNILEPYILKGEIKYFYQPNGGLPHARNTGISKASGEYILILDADDALMPDTMSETIRSIADNHEKWVIVDVLRIENGHEEIRRAVLPGHDDPFMDIFKGVAKIRAILFEKKTLQGIGNYDPEQKIYEDVDLHIRLSKKKVPFAYAGKPLYRYQIRQGSLTKKDNIRRNLYYLERIYRKHYKFPLKNSDKEIACLYSSKMWKLGSDYFHKAGKIFDASRCFIESIRYDGGNLGRYLNKHLTGVIKKR